MAYFNGCPYGNGPQINEVVCDACFSRHPSLFDTNGQQVSPWRWAPRWSMTYVECAWSDPTDPHAVDTMPRTGWEARPTHTRLGERLNPWTHAPCEA